MRRCRHCRSYEIPNEAPKSQWWCGPICKGAYAKAKFAAKSTAKLKKAKPKKKLKSIARLVDEVAVLMQRLVRLKAANSNGYCKCVSCGEVYHWKAMDGGHFISRKYQGTKIIEEQINPQCKKCNGWPDTFTTLNYEQYMKDTYGPDFVEHLKVIAKRPASFDRGDLERQKQELAAQINELERSKAA